ncbi:MAG: nitrilase-related carbon-nitrogen hydrolase [Spirochaetia bacterium]
MEILMREEERTILFTKTPVRVCTAVFLLFLSAVFVSPALETEEPKNKTLGVGAVQYEVKPKRYSSLNEFNRSVEDSVVTAVSKGAEVVVFPEYINVFLAFSREMEDLVKVESIDEGLEVIGSDSVHRLLLERSEEVGRLMDRIWGDLAEENSVWIVAGSYFAEEGEKLYNRSAVYGPKGKRVHEQDKVALTPFEEDVLNLSSGKREDADTFNVGGWDFALTICRDTFFDRWNKKFEEADVWIDIKANGAEYNTQTAEKFEEALPERIDETEVPYGVTACLNGKIFELFWEGPSSIIRWKESSDGEEEWEYIHKAEGANEEEILVEELLLSRDLDN